MGLKKLKDRRGINDQGDFSHARPRFTNLLRLFFRNAFCYGSNGAKKGPAAHTFEEGHQNTDEPIDTKDEGMYIVNGKTLRPLIPGSTAEASWMDMEKAIISFIAVTPANEYQFTPSIVVEAYEVGRNPEKTKPTVLISCSSQPYGRRMAKTLRRSGVLETNSDPFHVMVRCS
ncbi:uncharacterized protein CLUP02_09927 [Colletotrichum lupini]|uniref:Uncharacterized protein n=1 Tax=Colletotrichum lupini TaxID=145971 RepID=A0A9Q8SWK4_9PEZI|nr:uncharacterized protein CLUP02_09927 [Colletotrichum lupini]UQC84430.1 hypothetical protein CLUP02_09927 [Colletotrichum lupini]